MLGVFSQVPSKRFWRAWICCSRRGKRPDRLTIAHPRLVRAVHEVVVGDVEIDVFRPAPAVEVADSHELRPLRVSQSLMAGMNLRRARIARIAAVVLQNVEARGGQKGLDALEVADAPRAAQTRAVAEDRAARLAGLRVDHVGFVVDSATGEKRVAAEPNVLGVRVVGQVFELRQICERRIFHVQPGAEAQDHHLETDLGALVDGGFNDLRIACRDVLDQRVCRAPRESAHAGASEPRGPFARAPCCRGGARTPESSRRSAPAQARCPARAAGRASRRQGVFFS